MKRKYHQIIAELTDKELLYHLYLTQIILLIVSLILGAILYDHFPYIQNFSLSDDHIFTIGIPTGVMIVIVDILLMKLLPASFYDDGGLNQRIFKNRHVFHTFIIALFVAFSEELLFRGIIQTKVGLVMASTIFAIIHYRYLFNWFLFLNIILLSFLIGIIYKWTGNLAVTIMMHFVIDFLLGLYIKFRHTTVDKNGEEQLCE
ncbi:CPBP family intramembrane glutamic endopeptidase [Neobacillus cucumis]|uniref:CPBP family intramembrane metalloprotease n=1 Tax=Neobacillus cucumis TaxID=1740721 RepID=A0A2N5H9A6_9BACI|nr:CPBP family intramembrane glutamic endopeptidase [Neobacillus cucumis]PLS02095.1 CPBP family intramembrane metalloprotease [Neobacillus cucumis]